MLLGVDVSSMSTSAAAPSVVRKRYQAKALVGKPGARVDELYTLMGPTTYTNDYVRKRLVVDGVGEQGLQVGDVIVFGDCGAYGAVVYSEFLTSPKPAEIVIQKDGTLLLASRQGTAGDLIQYWAA